MNGRKFSMVAVPLLTALTLSMRAGFAPAAAAQPPNFGTVIVTDSALMPLSVTIRAGGSVLWTNRGHRPHKIAPRGGAFNAFELAAAQSHRVPFLHPGAYPYTVDAATRGMVVVIAGSTYVPPAGGANPPSGPENCGHPTTYLYDVELAVHRDETHTFTPPADNPGNPVHRVIDWQAKWYHAAMSVELCRGRVRILLPAGTQTSSGANEGLAAAESTVKLAWDDESELIVGLRQDPSAHVPTCHFTDSSGSPATLALDGDRFGFRFHAKRTKPQAYPIDRNCDPRRAKSGPSVPLPDTVSNTLSPFHTIDGLDWILTEQSLNLFASNSRAPMPYPVNALARGKGFGFRTGPLQTEIRTPGSSNAVSDWATVSFTPVRP